MFLSVCRLFRVLLPASTRRTPFLIFLVLPLLRGGAVAPLLHLGASMRRLTVGNCRYATARRLFKCTRRTHTNFSLLDASAALVLRPSEITASYLYLQGETVAIDSRSDPALPEARTGRAAALGEGFPPLSSSASIAF